MPGTEGRPVTRHWFKDIFGFEEGSYAEAQRKLVWDESEGVLRSTVIGKSFHVGWFETPSLGQLHERLETFTGRADHSYMGSGSIAFENIVADVYDLHLDSANEGAVFQVSSLCNCLQTITGRRPEDGITRYAFDHSQGSVAALACPAAAVFRNYFLKGTGQGGDQQLDCMSQLGEVLNNDTEGHWRVKMGYCYPRVPGKIAAISARIAQDPDLADHVRENLQVGIHWDTEVARGGHRVCQVFCYALPVSCVRSTRSADWAGFATAVLEAMFDAALTAAGTLAVRRGERVKVYLTPVGICEDLGNRREWIALALDRALHVHGKEPLDVALVHYGHLPPKNDPLMRLENGRRPERVIALASRTKGLIKWTEPSGEGIASVAQQLKWLFSIFDQNGDGYIDRREFADVLQMADGDFFTPTIVDLLLLDADKDGSGTIHYDEFCSWVFREDAEVVGKLPPNVCLRAS